MCNASPPFPRHRVFRDDCTINEIKSKPPLQGENKVVIADKSHFRILKHKQPNNAIMFYSSKTKQNC